MKEEQDFQIFIVSRFLVCIIYVVLSEFLIWFFIGRVILLFHNNYAVSIYILGAVCMVLPIIVASLMFSKVLLDEVHRVEEKKEEMRQLYEKKRNLMLSDIAHDLRTPITTIAGYSKALNDEMVTSEEKKKEYLQAIESKSQRMNDLINLLFEYIRLDSANFSLKKETIDIAELLRTNAASLYSDIEEKGMTLFIQIPEEPCMVAVDRVQFSRVIVNLINNAIKHNEAGTEISLTMEKENNKLRIEVSDNGELIAPFLSEHIFEPFAMGDASRRTEGGSGLGLSIAKKIVEMHGGTLRLNQNYEVLRKTFVIEIALLKI